MGSDPAGSASDSTVDLDRIDRGIASSMGRRGVRVLRYALAIV